MRRALREQLNKLIMGNLEGMLVNAMIPGGISRVIPKHAMLAASLRALPG
tara:strand:- start:864 stop:1013 length:150 start_codon:yes stop_codon:yes gene_type:complete